MDSLIFELQIVFYFQLFLSANVRHRKLVGQIIQKRKTEYVSNLLDRSLWREAGHEYSHIPFWNV